MFFRFNLLWTELLYRINTLVSDMSEATSFGSPHRAENPLNSRNALEKYVNHGTFDWRVLRYR